MFVLIVLTTAHCQTNDWSKRIRSKTERPLSAILNPHVGEVNVLVVDGKRFEHVRGLRSFYLPVPKINAIIFVVDEKDYSITYHIFRMDTEKDIEIHAPSSVFGRTIGFPNSQDTVEKISDGILVLGNVDNNARSTLQSLSNLCTVKSLYYLDLNKRTVAASKTLYLDKEGKLILERDDP